MAPYLRRPRNSVHRPLRIGADKVQTRRQIPCKSYLQRSLCQNHVQTNIQSYSQLSNRKAQTGLHATFQWVGLSFRPCEGIQRLWVDRCANYSVWVGKWHTESQDYQRTSSYFSKSFTSGWLSQNTSSLDSPARSPTRHLEPSGCTPRIRFDDG
jgi:hypothetical protein